MPRIYNAMSDPLDFCKRCFPGEKTALHLYGDDGREADQGPDGRGNCYSWDDDHPPYDGEGYHCFKCGHLLGDRDEINRHTLPRCLDCRTLIPDNLVAQGWDRCMRCFTRKTMEEGRR